MASTSTPSSHAAATHPAAQTPMMRQFFEAKAQHPDAILLFRMGDFYETFFEDAEEAARLLELTLTSRNKKDDDPIPMAGVPHHALWSYVPRLLEAGRKVAICEQVEDPRDAKGLVRRQVVRVITPGVVLDAPGLASHQNNYLAALWRAAEDQPLGLAWIDASTGERTAAPVHDLPRALDELARIEPAELVLDAADGALAASVAERFPELLRSPVAVARLDADPEPLAGAVALVDAYLARTQLGTELPLKPVARQDLDGALRLGATAVRNLELCQTLADGKRRGSLLGLIDQTRTAMGSRRVKQWLLYPLLEAARIRRRHEAVAALVEDPITRATVREDLAEVYDLERLVTRTVAGTAGPRDIAALASSLERVGPIGERLSATGAPVLEELAAGLDPVREAIASVHAGLVDEPPAVLKDGGVMREGFHPELDELIAVGRDGKAWFQRYAEKLRAESGIGSLKIRFNNVFGYFIEVTKANLRHVPDTWLRKQTLANSERYYTPELKEREEKVLGAHDRRIALELELFETLRGHLARLGARIQATADAVATLDVLAGLAELAQRRGYVRPEVDEGFALDIRDGRHPVIESLVPAGEFVPNDVLVDADDDQILIITGPNMAGKSTVMRQAALIVILAQMGSFVPAAAARIGVVDQVFTRVGASDNLTRGLSTFMVEMTEAAAILATATRRSLVVLDEIGRGTSTYDGVSIAWAVAEHLHDAIGARTLFATHYHELTELAATRPRIANMTIAVRQWKDDIVFLRRLVPGGTNRSYGIQVGRLAGLPSPVVERAREILANLELAATDPDGRPRAARSADAGPAQPWQLSLFAPAAAPTPSQVEARLAEIDPDELTPRGALELLYELRALLEAT